MSKKSCPVNRTFEKPVVIVVAVLSAIALPEVTLAVKRIVACLFDVFVSDTADTL